MATKTAERWAAPSRHRRAPALAGLVMLCRQLGRATDAERLGHPDQAEMEPRDLRKLVRTASAAGIDLRTGPASKRRLAALPPPFLLLSDERVWLVRDRAGELLMLVDVASGSPEAATVATAAKLAQTTVSIDDDGQLERPSSNWRGSLMRSIRPALAEIVAASVFINLLALATPVFMMTVYNKVINHAALATLDVLAIGMITLMVFELILRATRGYIVAHAGARLDVALSKAVTQRLLGMSQRRFETTPTGELAERLRQLDQLRSFMTGNLPLLLVDLAFVSLFVAAIFFLSPTLGWITACAMPGFVLISALAHKRQKKLVAASFKAGAAKSTTLNEAVTQALTVKALGLEGEMERRFEARQLESAWTGFRAARLGHLVGSSGQALQHLTGLIVIYFGAKMIIDGGLSIGALIACTILSARALAPMRQLFHAWHQLQQAREAMGRLDKLFADDDSKDVRGLPLSAPLSGRIALENVSFRYARDKAMALDGVDLEIEPGTMLAVIGPPGSGKSTLARLLSGLEAPSDGRVLLDGQDIVRLSAEAYRPQIGMVPQEVQLFAGSIAENIAIGSDDRSLGRIIAAARFVGLHDIVQRLPEGYETPLSERGGGLSLGQRQLVTIARALVRNPRILILDEATSALDTAAEASLMRNLEKAGGGRTIIMITHRRSVAERCDQAVFLQHGRLVRCGEPAEVLALAEATARAGTLHAVN